MAFLTAWLEHYGYLVLFFSLLLEMLALPLPGEVMMSYTGLLVYEGKLHWLLSITMAWAGASTGVTLSYWIGLRLGTPFFEKYGRRIHLGPEKIEKVSVWFQKYGNKMLVVSYFIPGVRHITGYFSGITRISYRKYAVYAYSGALLWTGLFISLGKILGPKWEKYHHVINRYLIIGGIIGGAIVLLVYMYRKYKHTFRDWVAGSLDKGIRHFHSLGKVKFLLLSAFALFVVFISLTIGLIQDFLSQEFALFDEVASYIVHRTFGSEWSLWMDRFALLGSYYVYTPLIAVTVAWIILKGKDRLLELTFFAWVIVGGEMLDEGLRLLFHRTSSLPVDYAFPYSFPSEQTLISLTVCGFAAFLLVRHYGNAKIRIAATLVVVILCLLVGVSRIYFDVQYASDVAAGYVFGGAWISLNVILLEIFRMLRKKNI